ncbi:MAG: hypothetical protein M9930_07495 [Anaerolineae bacterium]|nr:hypothetical protein [Anaerolineae bacterium]
MGFKYAWYIFLLTIFSIFGYGFLVSQYLDVRVEADQMHSELQEKHNQLNSCVSELGATQAALEETDALRAELAGLRELLEVLKVENAVYREQLLALAQQEEKNVIAPEFETSMMMPASLVGINYGMPSENLWELIAIVLALVSASFTLGWLVKMRE